MNNDKLVDCFVEALGVEKHVVVDTLAYNSLPQWDSVAHMVLVSTLEDTFDIMLDTDDIIDMSTVAKSREILGKYEVEF
ncbi:MAG: acyl carrier protein [Endozoicomonas sp.]